MVYLYISVNLKEIIVNIHSRNIILNRFLQVLKNIGEKTFRELKTWFYKVFWPNFIVEIFEENLFAE